MIWTLTSIAQRLNDGRQRASYGAVAGLLGVLPRGLMNGQLKSHSLSWIVAASGPQRGSPTGYTVGQTHPECLRQIESRLDNVIESPERLRHWLTKSPDNR
jgi:hypothetical protein